MVIYECDMCGKQSKCERDMHSMIVGGNPFVENVKRVMVCNECYGKIGDFIRGYKSRMNGLNCTIDSQFARKDKQ